MYKKSITIILSLLVLLSVLLVCQPVHAIYPRPVDPKYDLNNDGAVNMTDIMLIAMHYNSKVGDGRYVAKYDINGDGVINMGDVMVIGSSFA